MLTCVLSGPLAGRSPLLQQLHTLGVDVERQPERGPSHGLPDSPETGWITAETDSLDLVERALAVSDRWQIRLHWPTPTCLVCNGHRQDTLGQPCVACKGRGVRNQPGGEQ